MNLTRRILVIILCVLFLIPNVALALSNDCFSTVVSFQGEDYKIEVIPKTDTTMLSRVTNLKTNETVESHIDLQENVVFIEGDIYRIEEELDPVIVPYAACTPGQTKTRRSTITLFDVKIQDKANQGRYNAMVFLNLLTVTLTKLSPLGGVMKFINGAITGGEIYDLYNSYKNGDMNVKVVATYHYKCVLMYDYDPGFDYNGPSYVPMWDLVDITW